MSSFEDAEKWVGISAYRCDGYKLAVLSKLALNNMCDGCFGADMHKISHSAARIRENGLRVDNDRSCVETSCKRHDPACQFLFRYQC